MAKSLIAKKRYLTSLDKGLVAELDVYDDFPFETVEVEFQSVEEVKSFVPPSWFGKDATYVKKYKNKELSKVVHKESSK